MQKEDGFPYKLNSITEAHTALGLPKPKHPLVSVISSENSSVSPTPATQPHVLNFYKISYRPRLSPKLKYGQGHYDFDEGGLLFASPNQVIGSSPDESNLPGSCSQYVLLIHPDFLLGYPLAKKIKQYGFFSYAANEALHLSEEEKNIVLSVFRMIETELNSRIDDFSQDVIVSQIELLFSYAQRFYKRQFITRKPGNNFVLQRLEELADDYFNNDTSLRQGLPTVQYFSEQLHLSPSYLSDILRSLMGQNAQQYIHNKLIEKAKEKLSATDLSVSEIAYELGFEHSQSFSKLFKSKTKQSPLAFRQSFS